MFNVIRSNPLIHIYVSIFLILLVVIVNNYFYLFIHMIIWLSIHLIKYLYKLFDLWLKMFFWKTYTTSSVGVSQRKLLFTFNFTILKKTIQPTPILKLWKSSSKREAQEYKSANSKYSPIKLTYPEFSGLPSEQGF